MEREGSGDTPGPCRGASPPAPPLRSEGSGDTPGPVRGASPPAPPLYEWMFAVFPVDLSPAVVYRHFCKMQSAHTHVRYFYVPGCKMTLVECKPHRLLLQDSE